MNQKEESEKLVEAISSDIYNSTIQQSYEMIEQWMNSDQFDPGIKSAVLYGYMTNIFASLLMNEVHQEGWNEICQKFTSKVLEMAHNAYQIERKTEND